MVKSSVDDSPRLIGRGREGAEALFRLLELPVALPLAALLPLLEAADRAVALGLTALALALEPEPLLRERGAVPPAGTGFLPKNDSTTRVSPS